MILPTCRFHRSLFTACSLLAAAQAPASELIPYPPPVQQAAPTAVERPARLQLPQAAPEDTYRRFEQEVRTLSASDRQALIRSFDQRRASAAKTGDVARELHYLRLLDVLRTTAFVPATRGATK